MTRVFRYLAVAGAVMMIAGCKIAVMVPSGGDVDSSNPILSCSEGNLCEFDITEAQLPFNESFTAIPKAGYVFEKWSDGADFHCANSTNPTCSINLPDSGLGRGLVALFDSGYLMPIFEDIGIDTDNDGIRNELDEDDDGDGLPDVSDQCPLDPDLACGGPYIIADGKIWFQPDLFDGVSWTDIAEACPAGECQGVLNGYNMNEWIWASGDDINSLFESYGASGDCAVVESFFDDGWRKTNTVVAGSSYDILGFINPSTPDPAMFGLAFMGSPSCDFAYYILDSFPWESGPVGAWFYRGP